MTRNRSGISSTPVPRGSSVPSNVSHTSYLSQCTKTDRSALKNSHIQYLYDLTFLYSSPGSETFRAPSLDEQLSCRNLAKAGYKFRIHVRRFALADLPSDDEALKGWCEQRWSEKDDWLDKEMKVDEKGEY